MIQPLARHALAHIEREDDVQRNLLVADEVHLLRDVVVENLEIAARQSENRRALLGNQHVDTNSFDFRGERWHLRLRGHRDRRQPQHAGCQSRVHWLEHVRAARR